MHRNQVWRLTVNYYPRAAEAGVQPVNIWSMPCDRCSLAAGKITPAAFYSAHNFQFAHPPSRADFIDLVRSLPWADHCWGHSLIPLIESGTNQWPTIDFAHKASSADVFDCNGRKVGHVEVRREVVYENQAYHTAFINVDALNQLVGYLGRTRDRACDVIRQNENRIREWIAEQVRTTGSAPDTFVCLAIRQVLVDAGLIRPHALDQ